MAMLVSGTSYTGDITLAKQNGTLLTLPLTGKYADRNVQFTIGAQSAAAAANTAAADADVESTDSGSVGGINIYDVIGTKQTSEPSSGYFIRVNATGSGSSKITAAGWLNAGNLETASTSKTVYFPVAAATGSISGSNTVTPSASVTGSNVMLSNTNNGISITATGGGSASASVTSSADTAGYVPTGTISTGTLSATSTTTSASSYISGVTIQKPATGTNSFSVTVPNGDSTVTFTFTVDSEGNVVVE